MRKLKILIAVLAILLLGATVIVNWQYNNIKALYYSQMYANGDIDSLIKNHYDEIDEYLDSNKKYQVRQSTALEEKLHQSKLITDEEFVGILTGKTDVEQIFGMEIVLDESQKFVSSEGSELSREQIAKAKQETSKNKPSGSVDPLQKPDNPSNNHPDKPKLNDKSNSSEKTSGGSKNNLQTDTNGNPSGSQPGAQKPTDTTSNGSSDEKVSECIARMYVLKSTFESQLDGIYAEATSYYSSLTPEQRKNAKSEMMKTFYGRATSLERSCDAQVSGVLSELQTALVASGESTELVNKIQTAYDEEKSLKKAYYINLYKSHN